VPPPPPPLAPVVTGEWLGAAEEAPLLPVETGMLVGLLACELGGELCGGPAACAWCWCFGLTWTVRRITWVVGVGALAAFCVAARLELIA
jgi:hypothetical protein